MGLWTLILFTLASNFLLQTSAQQCGSQAGGALCPNGLCCSQFGYCGSTPEFCTNGCQSQCGGSTPTPTSGGGGTVSSILPQSLFNQMLKYRNDGRCESNGFYTYSAFITAAQSFNGFGTTGDVTTRKRELAAFLGQTSHETTGGWPSAPDGPYAWGYCFIRERNRANLLNNPDLVATNAVLSFRAAMWFWMTPQGNKPSSHDVITGRWTPSAADRSAGRVPGYGVITNIINGALECGRGPDARVADRIGFYNRYCGIIGVPTGSNLDCYNQRSF